MWLLRVVWYLIIGFGLSVFQVGFFAILPYPLSDVSLLTSSLALSFSFRFDPKFFWVLCGTAAGLELYSGTFFGAVTIAFVITTLVVMHITTAVVSHRSLLGCVVIGAVCGGVWSILFQIMAATYTWFMSESPVVLFSTDVWRMVVTQIASTALFNALFYELLPRWWRDHSPVVVGGRGV